MFERINNNTRMLERALDASWLRNEAIAQNIANVDTPGYKRKTVEFESYLNSALEEARIKGRRTHKKHLPVGIADIDSVEPTVTQDNTTLSMRLDGNNVDIDTEMASMAKNTIKYNVMIQSLNTEFRRIKSAIKEGRV